MSPLCAHLARPPAEQWPLRDSGASQAQVLALSQDGPAVLSASCEALHVLSALSPCDFPIHELGVAIVARREWCRKKSRTNEGKALRAESWHAGSTQ